MNMAREDILNTRWGLFLDLLACSAIDSGGATQKEKKKTQEEIIFDMR